MASPSKSQTRKYDPESCLDSKTNVPVKFRKLDHTETRNDCDFLPIPFWKELNRSFCHFQANQIGHFSIRTREDNKERFPDARYLRVYKYPMQSINVNFDLKIGESEFVARPQSKSIDSMLWWAKENKEKIFKDNQFTFDFFSWRGVLRLIMFSIFEKHSDWLIAVVKFKNAYFICEFVTDMQIKDEQNMKPEHRSFCYYGHKFEECVTRNFQSTETLNNLTEFSGVYQSTIGANRLLYGAEIDCIVENSSPSHEHIELKVCAGKSMNDLPFQHNRKFAKWWIQCFLIGIQRMIIGLRDNNGIVEKLEPLNISDIERAARTWTRQSFLNFFSLFADFVKKHVTKDYSVDYQDVTLFHFIPSSQTIKVEKSSDPKFHFLRDWFVNEFS